MAFDFKKRKQHLFIACFIWAVFLAVVAVQPKRTMNFFLPTEFMKSLAHSAAYGVLTFNLCLYFRFKRSFWGCHLNEITATGISLFLTGVWGAVTECSQFFTPDRRPDVIDWAWDMGGAIVGVIIFYLIRGWL